MSSMTLKGGFAVSCLALLGGLSYLKPWAGDYSSTDPITIEWPDKTLPPIQITLNGESQEFYSAQVAWADAIVEGDEIAILAGRSHFSTVDTKSAITPEELLAPNLLGGSIEWDVDLSQVACGCDTAVYLVAMPGRNTDGSLADNSDRFWYCGGGTSTEYHCPEFDLMEANKYSFRSTVHMCDDPDAEGYIDACLSGRCSLDQYDYEGFGQGGSLIDTKSPFSVKVDFIKSETGTDQLSHYVVTLTQEGRELVMDGTGCQTDISKMGPYLAQGMTLTYSIWQQNPITWLTHDICENFGCTDDSISMISNVRVTKGTY